MSHNIYYGKFSAPDASNGTATAFVAGWACALRASIKKEPVGSPARDVSKIVRRILRRSF